MKDQHTLIKEVHMPYEKTLEYLNNRITEFQEELQKYVAKGMTNKSQAQRLRKKSSDLGKLMKDFRANSIEHHKSPYMNM